MSFTRVFLLAVQLISNQLAFTPPNPTQEKFRYHKEEPFVLQIAPFIFKNQHLVLWFCAVAETLHYLTKQIPFSMPGIHASAAICPAAPQTTLGVTPIFLIGVLASILGSYIRLDCFKALGELFTFDLTVHPHHKLITNRFYSYVRHPAYTGSILLVIGITFSHLTQGSWLTTCGPLRSPWITVILWITWWAWTISVGTSRCEAEDKQMRKLFGSEWEAYAARVQWWFFPGLL